MSRKLVLVVFGFSGCLFGMEQSGKVSSIDTAIVTLTEKVSQATIQDLGQRQSKHVRFSSEVSFINSEQRAVETVCSVASNISDAMGFKPLVFYPLSVILSRGTFGIKIVPRKILPGGSGNVDALLGKRRRNF